MRAIRFAKIFRRCSSPSAGVRRAQQAVNVEARPALYRFLRELVDAGYGDRLMLGFDRMVCPGLIDAGVRSLEAAPFLNARQKRDILYNNAARFLRLSTTEIARHHWR